MAISEEYLDYVLEQMSLVRSVSSRKMFGGLCLFYQGKAFGLIAEDVLYLKVDDSNRADFEAVGMGAFVPFPDKPQYKMGYFEVPIDVLEDRTGLKEWSMKAIAVSKKAAAKKRKKP